MGLKVGICGLRFGGRFVQYFQRHPLVEKVLVADLMPERVQSVVERFGVTETYATLDELLRSDIDALGLFTQEWTHAPLAIQALKLGKHVYSALPAAVTVEEMEQLIEAVKATGRTYMVGETSYYYPSAIYCRERFARGDFGAFVYGEAAYMHDVADGMYTRFELSNGDAWKRIGSMPPMLYATHATNFLRAVTGTHYTRVSCLGRVDDVDDGIFRADLSQWGNTFSNQTALLRTADGGMATMNLFRRVGHAETLRGSNVRLSLYGTKASFEDHSDSKVWVEISNGQPRAKQHALDLTKQLTCAPHDAVPTADLSVYPGLSSVHPRQRLPASYLGIKNGHEGSHPFLVDDFVQACVNGRRPLNDVWSAARDCVPGMIAHESSRRGGEMLPIPDFGDGPAAG